MSKHTEYRSLIEASAHGDSATLKTQAVSHASGLEVEPGDVLHSIRRCGRRSLMVALPVAFLLGSAVYWLQKPKYRASAILQLSSTEQSLVFEDRVERSDYEIFQATQRELVSSRYLMSAAAREDVLKDTPTIKRQANPVEWMLKNVDVSTPELTEIMSISTVTRSADDSVNIVNGVVDAYLTAIVNRNLEIRQNRLEEITRALDDKQKEVRARRQELKRLVEELGSSDSQALSVIQQLQVQEIGSLRSQLMEVHRKKWEAEAELSALRVACEAAQAAPNEKDVTAALETDPVYKELLRDKLSNVRMRAQAAAFEDRPSTIENRGTSLLDQQLADRRDRVREQVAVSQSQLARQELQKNQQEMHRIRAGLDLFAAMEDQIKTNIVQLEEDFGKVGNQSIDVEMMRSEIQQLDEVVGNIKKQSEELEVEINSRPRVEVLMKPTGARVVNKTQRMTLASFAGLFGLITPVGLLLMMDLLKFRVNSSRSLSNRTGLPIIGTMPVVPGNLIRQIPRDASRRAVYWETRLAESVKRISSRLISESSDAQSQVMLVTSAQRKEGKTTLATQLATCLANYGRSVLLVDLDLRSPSVHRVHGVKSSPGVCDLLRGDTDLASAIQSTSNPNLSVLAAGQCCGTALQALGYGTDVKFFQELRGVAEFVIVDGCPVLTSSDIGFICLHVDEVILAARRDVSRINDVRIASEFIRNTNTPISGAVVVEPDNSRHHDRLNVA